MNRPTRIFIVDDHPLVRDWMTTLLRREPDFEVCGHADGVRAALGAMPGMALDIAIIDLGLKDGSGLDLIRALKKQLPALNVIVLSMHEESSYADRAFRAGARGYVTKRESSGQIVEAIHQVKAGRIYANHALLRELAERAFATRGKNANAVDALSDRELEVFRRIGSGRRTRDVALDLGVSPATVQTYCMRIKEKLGLASNGELIREAVCWVQEENRPRATEQE